MRAKSSCCARMIEVTAVMPAAADSQPCSIHWRLASAIGSTGRRLVAATVNLLRPPYRQAVTRRVTKP
jgi:hypothetical protein